MKPLSTLFIPGMLLTASFTVCENAQSAEKPLWSGKMQALYKTLAEVLTDVSSDERFHAPSNKKKIQKEADQLASLSHDLTGKEITLPDRDPTLPVIAKMLKDDTQRAASELRRGNRSYARTILRSIPSYCIGCHTRNQTGPQFSTLAFEPSSKTLSPLERGSFFIASRQFDRAETELKKVITDSQTARVNVWDFELAVQQRLAIAVRVKNDPLLAEQIVDSVIQNKKSALYLRNNAKNWKTSIEEWKSDSQRKIETETELYAEAFRLMNKATEIQKYPMDRNADILYLRASALIHKLLQKNPKGKLAAEALLLAGLSYEVLAPLKLEELHQIYYESCIREAPHTALSETCYLRLESSIYLGFTGSQGRDVPGSVGKKLLDLKNLSELKDIVQEKQH